MFFKTKMKIPIRIVIRAVNIYPWKQICTTIIGWLQYVTSSTATAAAAKSLAAPNRIILLWIHMQIRWKTEILNHSTHPILCADMSKLVGICIWESHVQMVQVAKMNGTHMVSVIGIDMRYLCITHIFKQINITYHRYIAFRLCYPAIQYWSIFSVIPIDERVISSILSTFHHTPIHRLVSWLQIANAFFYIRSMPNCVMDEMIV